MSYEMWYRFPASRFDEVTMKEAVADVLAGWEGTAFDSVKNHLLSRQDRFYTLTIFVSLPRELVIAREDDPGDLAPSGPALEGVATFFAPDPGKQHADIQVHSNHGDNRAAWFTINFIADEIAVALGGGPRD